MTSQRSSRSRLAPLAAVVVITMSLAACGGGSGGTTQTTPDTDFTPGTLDKQYSGTTIDVLVPAWAALPKESVATFTDKTGIKVSQQTLDFDAVRDKIVTAGAAGQSPADVTEVDWTWASQFAKAKWYADLSEYLPAKTISEDAGADIFKLEGQQVAVPYNLDFRASAMNMTMLNEAGITEAPQTWDQVFEAAQAIKASGGAKYPVALPLSATEGSATPWYVLTTAAGGDLLDDQGAPAFDDAGSAGVQAAAFIKKLWDAELIDPGSTNLNDQDVTDAFIAGSSAIVPSASPGLLGLAKTGDASTIQDDDVALVSPPGPDGPAEKLIGLQEGLGIPARSEHREAAAMFIYWWQQQDQQLTSYTDPNMGNVPSQTPVLAALADSDQLVGGDQIATLSGDVGPAFPAGVPTWYSQFSANVASMLQAVVNGKQAPPEAVDQLAKQTQALNSGG